MCERCDMRKRICEKPNLRTKAQTCSASLSLSRSAVFAAELWRPRCRGFASWKSFCSTDPAKNANKTEQALEPRANKADDHVHCPSLHTFQFVFSILRCILTNA